MTGLVASTTVPRNAAATRNPGARIVRKASSSARTSAGTDTWAWAAMSGHVQAGDPAGAGHDQREPVPHEHHQGDPRGQHTREPATAQGGAEPARQPGE